MFNYPFYFWYYRSSFKLFGFKIPFIQVVYRQDLKLNPVYWITDYYSDKPTGLDDYCYYDYEDDEDEVDEYYCYCYYDYEDDEDEVDLLSSQYENGLLICSAVRRKNGYTALASQHVLIADIDCGDDIEKPLQILTEYANKHDAYFKVYKTLNGMRYIQLNTIYQNVNRSAINVLKYLGSDPKYIAFCSNDGRFMARVTPKSDSEGMKLYLDRVIKGLDTEVKTALFIDLIGNKDKYLPIVNTFVYSHDRLTNKDSRYIPLG